MTEGPNQAKKSESSAYRPEFNLKVAFVRSSVSKPLGGTVLDGKSEQEKKSVRPTFTEKAPLKSKKGSNLKSVRFSQEVEVKEFNKLDGED